MYEPRQSALWQTVAKTHTPVPRLQLIAPVLTILAALCLGSVSGCATTDPTTANGNQFGAIEYQVKQGDNLVLIAAEVTRNRDNWRLIADYNAIGNPATLSVGQRIWIPRDLIPLNEQSTKTRSVAGHPDAVVNSVARPTEITPISAE